MKSKVVFIDYETHYDKDFSLSKMTTEAYIRDPRFKVHSMAIAVGDGPVHYIVGEDNLKRVAATLEGEAVVAHNCAFDSAILQWHYGARPTLIIDTMSMSKGMLGPALRSHSLNSVSEYLGLGKKIEGALVKTLGVQTLSDDQHRELAPYARQDVELCRSIFKTLFGHMPAKEMALIDWTMRAYTEPKLLLNKGMLDGELSEIHAKRDMVRAVFVEGDLVSNNKFADLLRRHGVEPPMKLSKATGEMTYAFAKTDTEFTALLNHPNEGVRQLMEARFALKSNIEVTRTTRFSDMADRGPMPIPLKYYGAEGTGRWSGTEGVNAQNMPRGGVLRDSIHAPEGYTIITADFAQIELRMTLALAGEHLALADLEEGKDLYCALGHDIFGRVITKADKVERHIAKSAVLGCGFGMGAARFLDSVTQTAPGFTQEQAQIAVYAYRNRFAGVPRLWRSCDNALIKMAKGMTDHKISPSCELPIDRCPLTGAPSIVLPNGMRIKYPSLKATSDGFSYFAGRYGDKATWGGSITENLAQALSRIIMSDALLRVNMHYPVVLSVHDELVVLVKDEDVHMATKFIVGQMTIRPDWMPFIPLDVEIYVGKTYGEK